MPAVSPVKTTVVAAWSPPCRSPSSHTPYPATATLSPAASQETVSVVRVRAATASPAGTVGAVTSGVAATSGTRSDRSVPSVASTSTR